MAPLKQGEASSELSEVQRGWLSIKAMVAVLDAVFSVKAGSWLFNCFGASSVDTMLRRSSRLVSGKTWHRLIDPT
jgi:hypothetical protein